MLVAATIGHAGRLSRLRDRGAVAGGLEEVSLVRRYTDALDRELRRLGHDCILLSDGRYSDQWARADKAGSRVYLNCHVNAGGGNRGEVFYDYRSPRGRALAEAVAAQLHREMPWHVWALAAMPDDDGQPRDEDHTEAYRCIEGVRAVALCVEPYFLDGPMVAWFVEHVDEVGTAIARGIDAWARANA